MLNTEERFSLVHVHCFLINPKAALTFVTDASVHSPTTSASALYLVETGVPQSKTTKTLNDSESNLTFLPQILNVF